MIALVKYEAARSALQACHDIDEVKDIRDKAQAMAAYAKQAKDSKLVEWASEIKVRAERRAGGMLAEMKINGSRHNGKHPENLLQNPRECPEVTPEETPTLETLGVTKKQSSQWQKVASIPEAKFEKAITSTKESAGMVTTAAVLRSAIRPERPAPKVEKAAKPKAVKDCAKCVSLEAKLADRQEALDEMADLAANCEAFRKKEEFKEMQNLRIEMRAVKQRRGELMRESVEQKKLIAHWKKKAEAK